MTNENMHLKHQNDLWKIGKNHVRPQPHKRYPIRYKILILTEEASV